MRRRVWIAGLVIASACQAALVPGQPAPSPEAVPLVRLRSGTVAFSTYTGVVDSLRTVVRDSSNWRRLWNQINRPFLPPPALPAIDFAREMIVVAALGKRSSGGYDVVIESAERDSSGIEVALRRASPAPGCPVAAVMTQPVDLARIPTSEQPVRFKEHNVLVPCGEP